MRMQDAIAAGILVAILVCWLAFHLRSKPTDPPTDAAEPTYPTARVNKPARGVFASILSGLAIGILTFLGPALINLDYGMLWFWVGGAIAPAAALIGGSIVYRMVNRRAEIAERKEKAESDLRDL